MYMCFFQNQAFSEAKKYYFDEKLLNISKNYLIFFKMMFY